MENYFNKWSSFINSFTALAKEVGLDVSFILVHPSFDQLLHTIDKSIDDFPNKFKFLVEANSRNKNCNFLEGTCSAGFRSELTSFPKSKNYIEFLKECLKIFLNNNPHIPMYFDKNKKVIKLFGESLGNAIYNKKFGSDELVIFTGDGACYLPDDYKFYVTLEDEKTILSHSGIKKVLFKPFGKYIKEYFENVRRSSWDIVLDPGLHPIQQNDYPVIKQYFNEHRNN